MDEKIKLVIVLAQEKSKHIMGPCWGKQRCIYFLRRKRLYAFAVTPCSYPDLDKWDAMIGWLIKSKHNSWRSTLNAMICEDVHSFGLGAPSIYVEYHRRSAIALVTSLEDPYERHQSVTVHLLTHQVAKALATTFLSTREGTSLPKNGNSTYICEHVNSLASKPASSTQP